MLEEWRRRSGAQGQAGPSDVHQNDRYPCLKTPWPTWKGQFPSFFFYRHTCKCPHTHIHTLRIPSLNSTYPCREGDQLLAIRTFCGHEITLEISSRKQEEGDKVLNRDKKREGVGRREGVLWISSAVKWTAHMCWQGEKGKKLEWTLIMAAVKITN